MNEHLEQLEPAPLWRHFRTFCETPRPSWHEEAILAKIEAWADQRGLAHERDEASNLRICKPATPDCGSAPGIVLQGHVDMVAEHDADVEHDFATDSIETYVEDGWLRARGTTLGADNGIGAAAGLAILEDEELQHGPLELLLTVAEEVLLVGAGKLAPNWLDGRLLLNLDTEEADEVTIGCAGGATVSTEAQLALQPIDEDLVTTTITVDGLNGGHSGIDIHTGRASANRLLARVLHALLPFGLRLIDYDGGRMDNAITRRACATVALPNSGYNQAVAEMERLQATFLGELAEADPNVHISRAQVDADTAASVDDTQRFVRLLYALPFGVERMSLAAPGVVETSNNIGVIQLHDGLFTAQIMVRSLVDSARDALTDRILAIFDLAGFPARRSSSIPGWAPDPNSRLLERFVGLHQRVTGHEPDVKVIHASLECGLIGAKYPHMDMVSFGPIIRGAHSPAERANIASVQTFYKLLLATVADIADAS